MGNEWESRAKINSCRQCRNVRDEFDVIVISNRRNKIIFELFVQSFERSIYRILSKFIELLGYLSPVRINIALLRIYFSFYRSKYTTCISRVALVKTFCPRLTRL